MFKGQTLFISQPCKSTESDATPPMVAIDELQNSTNTVKVTNILPSLTDDMLILYFTNAKRSHGGEIKDLYLIAEKKKAFITFRDPSGTFI